MFLLAWQLGSLQIQRLSDGEPCTPRREEIWEVTRHDSEFHAAFKNDTCPTQKRWRWVSQRQTTTECALSHAKPLPFYQLHVENTISSVLFQSPKTCPLHELPQDGVKKKKTTSCPKIAQNRCSWNLKLKKPLSETLSLSEIHYVFQWCQVYVPSGNSPHCLYFNRSKNCLKWPKVGGFFFRRDQSYHHPNGILTCTFSPTHLLNNLVVFPHGRFQFRLEFFNKTHRIDWNTSTRNLSGSIMKWQQKQLCVFEIIWLSLYDHHILWLFLSRTLFFGWGSWKK